MSEQHPDNPAPGQDSAVSALETLCLQLGVTAESMTDLIHDEFSRGASNINNSGMPDQLRYVALNGNVIKLEDKFREMGLDVDIETYIFNGNFEAMAAALEVLGVECGDLDELVHDSEGAGAASINNSGLKGQIECLVSRLGPQEAERLIRSHLRNTAGVTP